MENLCEASSSCDDVPWLVEDIPKPIGDVLKISGEGSQLKNHYSAFEFHEDTYKLDICETESKELMLNVQWFYRPKDIPPRKGLTMDSVDTRELFYSFHKDEVPVEAVSHKCKVHFVTKPSHIPARKKYPGFIVRKLYNPVNKRFNKLTDNNFLPDAQQEINMLVQMTMRNLNILPDNESIDHAANIESIDCVANNEDVYKSAYPN
ncbi:ASI1-immunoprecipitated protein 3-like [Bidens hawaiensis]|uniref:ASI1-immunoprecipitated protein 3-like n=1 Tax=Bidens hawaiensis TaxID=980011 RepID=UPI00404A278F